MYERRSGKNAQQLIDGLVALLKGPSTVHLLQVRPCKTCTSTLACMHVFGCVRMHVRVRIEAFRRLLFLAQPAMLHLLQVQPCKRARTLRGFVPYCMFKCCVCVLLCF